MKPLRAVATVVMSVCSVLCVMMNPSLVCEWGETVWKRLKVGCGMGQCAAWTSVLITLLLVQ